MFVCFSSCSIQVYQEKREAVRDDEAAVSDGVAACFLIDVKHKFAFKTAQKKLKTNTIQRKSDPKRASEWCSCLVLSSAD